MKKTGAKKSGKALRKSAWKSRATRAVLGAFTPRRRDSAARPPAKWEWHFRTLLALRETLGARRGGQMRRASEPVAASSASIAEGASDQFDHDIALSSLSSGQDALFEIEEALDRIRTGAYGVCEATGRPISAARLKAIPWARFSRDAEARLEERGAVSHPKLGELRSVQASASPGESETEPEEESEQRASDAKLAPEPPAMPGGRARERRAAAPASARKAGGRSAAARKKKR